MYQKSTIEIKGEYEVVYNLSEVVEGLYLPLAYIVRLDKDGLLAHIQQRAMEDTVGSFDLELSPERKRLFQLTELLQPKHLEKKFSPPKRKIKTLEVLWEDDEVRKAILRYVHRLLDEYLTIISANRYPITWEVERKVLVKDFLMKHGEAVLEPRLAFKKTEGTVSYWLSLQEGDRLIRISEHEVIPITNHPAWIFLDYRLCRVRHINGNMVKPFRKKDEVRIPGAQVRTYFQKFILKVAAQVDIEAEGFEVVQYEHLQACRVEVVRNFVNNRLGLNVKMIYPQVDFLWHDPKGQRTSLQFAEEEVRIIRVIRDLEAEKERLRELVAAFDLQSDDHNLFLPQYLPDDDPYALVEWLIAHRPELETLGFQVRETELADQKLYLEKAQLELRSDQENDWFDIFGQVKVGAFTFPFTNLAKYIRDDNRFYPLPDGSFFLIPLEWMNRYRSLVKFAHADGLHLRLKKAQFTLLQEIGIEEDTQVIENLKEVEFVPSQQLQAELRPYQLEGAKWLVQLYRNELGGCLADDMGLGKTLQTITVLLHAKEEKARRQTPESASDSPQLNLFAPAPDEPFLGALNALIILPASLVFNWERELGKFAPHLTVYKHVGSKRQKDPRILRRFDVILTTYQTALRDVETLLGLEYEYIVLDESQQIKNRESKVFKAINRLESRHKISLSGTPIENSLSDLWSQMQFINPNLLGSFSFFKKEFITPIEKYNDDEKKDRLRGLVAPYLLRRTKEEVARDLPPLTTKIFYSEMTAEQKRLYEREKSAARNLLLEHFEANNPQYRIQVLQSLTKLRQLVNHPQMVRPAYEKDSGKFNDVLEHWDVIRRSGHKALFFSSFVKYLNLFREHFDRQGQAYSWLTGDLTPKEREAQIRRFETQQEVQSFLISIKSGGTGLNLTAADYVFILDPWWNPTTEQQAIARAHRIGQNNHVIAVKFITKDSIEEKILKLQDRKTRLAEDIIDNVRKADLTRGDIEYLLE